MMALPFYIRYGLKAVAFRAAQLWSCHTTQSWRNSSGSSVQSHVCEGEASAGWCRRTALLSVQEQAWLLIFLLLLAEGLTGSGRGAELVLPLHEEL
ncbi:hypothetical protein AOLI_G00185760 [Acnodon oligacanthus]